MKQLLLMFLLCGCAMAQKQRVFVETADPASSSAATVSTYYASSHGEQIRLLSQACPAIAITEDATGADFIVRWESKTWQQTSWAGHQQEFTLLNPSKEVLGTGAAHQVKNAAKDVCKLITQARRPSPQTPSR
ncbi:MAG: hypothetical protein WCC95_03375 [Candidatus Sulfotelmatobacter sp.]|jgi:hypothetical protein